MKKIVVVEDENRLRENIIEILQMEGYETFAASNGKEGLNEIKKNNPDIILCDIKMNDYDGMDIDGNEDDVIDDDMNDEIDEEEYDDKSRKSKSLPTKDEQMHLQQIEILMKSIENI
jgi:FixJ family two-component response regulator